LSLEEEYAMQKSWREDADKLTFITALPPPPETVEQVNEVRGKLDDVVERLIGDVNLFLFADEEQEEDESSLLQLGEGRPVRNLAGEVEIMVARRDLQGQGLGRASLLLFLDYILAHISTILEENHQSGSGDRLHDGSRSELKYLRVKINHSNTRSRRLFESVGFHVVGNGEPNYFGEVELRMQVLNVAYISELMERFGIADVKEVEYVS
jgi:RimJ/RimL family protein N-acetyltransferase